MSTRSMNWLKFGGLVALAFALGLLFAGLLDLPTRSLAQERARTAGRVIADVQAPKIPEARPLYDLSEAFAAVANAVRPSVVYIESQHTEAAPRTRQQVPPGFERFFPQAPNRPRFEEGTGSGFIVSPDGYILTNNHVVEGADKVKVRLFDRREYQAKVVGTDPNTDVAVLKIDATNLPPIALGNSDTVNVGEWVLAIGNPLGEGLSFTVTQGIVSAKGRSLRDLYRGQLSIGDFIQTDAAINPGNSGGPLVNVRGQVIGINSAIASQTGFYSGYGFAIPINLVRQVMQQLITSGHVERAALGIRIQDASINDAAYVGLEEPRGVLVVGYGDDNSAAKRAGIQPGDVIVAVDGDSVNYTGQLQQRIAFQKPGTKVAVTVMRKGGAQKTFDVTLQPQGEVTDVAATDGDSGDDEVGPTRAAPTSMGRLGLTVQTLSADMARTLGLSASTHGVVVTGVTPGGPSYQLLGEPAGGAADVITSVEGKPVASEAELRKLLGGYKAGDVVTLDVLSPQGARRPPVQRIVRVRLGGD